MIERKLFEKVDDNPGEYFGMLVESVEDGYMKHADADARKVKSLYRKNKDIDSVFSSLGYTDNGDGSYEKEVEDNIFIVFEYDEDSERLEYKVVNEETRTGTPSNVLKLSKKSKNESITEDSEYKTLAKLSNGLEVISYPYGYAVSDGYVSDRFVVRDGKYIFDDGRFRLSDKDKEKILSLIKKGVVKESLKEDKNSFRNWIEKKVGKQMSNMRPTKIGYKHGRPYYAIDFTDGTSDDYFIDFDKEEIEKCESLKEGIDKQLVQKLYSMWFSKEQAEWLAKNAKDYAESLAYGHTTTDDLIEAEEYVNSKMKKQEAIKESVSKSDLYSALEYMYGFNKKEANDWIKKASDKMKQSVVDGWKGNAKKSALTDSLKEDKFVSRDEKIKAISSNPEARKMAQKLTDQGELSLDAIISFVYADFFGKEESLKEDKFVPQDKMSKKAQKELNDKKRGTWGSTNPVTRVQPNKKAYDRKRDKKELDEVITNYSQEDIKEIKKISMTCFYIVRRYYNNLYNRDYSYSSVLDFADALHTCAEQIDSFINKTK